MINSRSTSKRARLTHIFETLESLVSLARFVVAPRDASPECSAGSATGSVVAGSNRVRKIAALQLL